LAIIVFQKVIRVTSHYRYYSMCSKCLPIARTQTVHDDATRQQHVQ